MTDQERAQILKMVNEGKISAEEGLRLMRALDENPEQEVEDAPSQAADSSPKPEPDTAARFARMRRFWVIPLWVGIGITVFGGWLMYWVMQETGLGFWFYCSWLPFVLGVAMIALSWASRTSRWLHIRVQRKPGHRPTQIVLSFPIPLKLTAWFLRTFGHFMQDLERTAVDEVLRALEESVDSTSPLYVEVQDDGDDEVEHVQVYIG